MRYRVPQNIDMEDRIVGPLTMLQFVYLMVGGMIIYLAYLLFTPTSFWIIAIPVGLFTLSLAFLKVQDQPFPKFLAATLLFLIRPKARVWAKESGEENVKIIKAPSTETKTIVTTHKAEPAELTQLAQAIDTAPAAPATAQALPVDVPVTRAPAPAQPTPPPAPQAAPPTPPTAEQKPAEPHQSWS